MAHIARLNTENKVIVVLSAPDDINESAISQATGQTWKQTSYNTIGNTHMLGGTPFRKNYAGIGYEYDADRDAFIPPKPYESWILNETTCSWEAPVDKPTGTYSDWNEDTQEWDSLV